jgi:hypothetical protein
MFDGMLHRPGYVRDALSDAALSDARRRVDDAYRAMCWRASEGWRSVPLLPAVHDAQEARARYIDQISNAWRQPTVRPDLRRADTTANGGRFVAGPLSGGPDSSWRPNSVTASQRRGARPPDDDDQDGDDLDYTASDPEGGDDDYTRGVWSAQSGYGPDGNEAYLRRMTMSEPDATAESVRAENARYRPRDSATAQRIRDSAYAQSVAKLSEAWRRP